MKQIKPTYAGIAAWALTAGAVSLLSTPAWALEPTHVKGTVIQELAEFDNPEGAKFSADGKSVYVTNAAIWDCEGFAWTEGGGSISKLSVGSDGKLTLVKKDFLTGLTAPLGMGVLPKATKQFPKGTLAIVVGSGPLGTSDCQAIKDPKRLKPGVLFFDETGKKLGTISLAAGTEFAKISGAPATLPNALDFDSKGNLYVANTGFAGGAFEPAIQDKPGIWKIPFESIDALASGGMASAAPQFILMPGGPDGVEVSPVDDSVHVNTVGAAVGMPDDAKGGMWRLADADFASGKLPAPFASGLGALDATDFTDGGVRVDTEIMNSGETGLNNIIITPRGLAHGQADGAPRYLALDKDAKLSGPADLDILKLANGDYLFVVPELTVGSKGSKDEITVIRVPAAIDKEM